MAAYKVLDTNILLISAENLVELADDGSVIVLPEVVLDEMDTKKSMVGELGYQARQFARLMNEATVGDKFEQYGCDIVSFELRGVTIYVATPKEYPVYTDTIISVINDRKIIHTANLFTGCVFLTNDVGCKIKALSLGIPTVDLKFVERTEFEFTKKFQVPNQIFKTLHNREIQLVDMEHKVMNYSYMFSCMESEQVKLAYINNGIIQILGKDTENDLRKQDINPKGSGQLLLSRALQDPSIDIVVAEGRAGTGKTLSSISNGIKLVAKGQYDGIIYMRNSVNDLEKEEEIGYLSTNEAKYDQFLHPLYDSLDKIVRNKYPKKNNIKIAEYEVSVTENIDAMKLKYNIQPMLTLGTRGRTFKRMYIVYDEGQNSSKSAFQKFLTRVGEDCKVVVCGSNRQIDHPYITKYNNGLSVLLNAMTEQHDTVKLYAIELQRVARGRITEFGESIFEDKKGEG